MNNDVAAINEERNNLKNIELIKTFEFGKIAESEKPKDVKEIFNDTRRRIIEVVDESFAGERAEIAKSRGEAIANRMQDFIAETQESAAI